MNPYYETDYGKLYNGHVLDTLKQLPSDTVSCCVTSPPYWKKRDYGQYDVEWGDGWVGELGRERDFNVYIFHLCDVFEEVKRVLRKDGTLFVNLGDTLSDGKIIAPKSLCNIPSRFSIEMQNRGWILRNRLVWEKPNSMPESVSDRFTIDYEDIFFFVKNTTYFFNQQFEELKLESKKRAMRGNNENKYSKSDYSPKGVHFPTMPKPRQYRGYDDMDGAISRGETSLNAQGRNKRSVWRISTKGLKGYHYAVFPEKLVETPIKAGCPKDICTKCGKPREKIIAKKEYIVDEKEPSNKFKDGVVNSAGGRAFIMTTQRKYTPNQKEVALYIKTKIKDKESLDDEFGQHTWTHWIRTDESGASLPNPEQYILLKDMLELDDRFDKEMLTTVKIVSDDKGGKTEVIGYTKCDCNAPFVPGIVLDPFMGSGTTAVYCEKNHYRWIGCEVSDKYCEMIKGRLEPYKKQTKLINFKTESE